MASTAYSYDNHGAPPPTYGDATGYNQLMYKDTAGAPPMPLPPVRAIVPGPAYGPEAPAFGTGEGYREANADPESGISETFGHSFSDKAIRRSFIRKVYLILTAQLLFTTAFIAFFQFHEPTKNWIQGPGRYFYYVSYVVFLVTYITLVCCRNVARSWPWNFICLSIFTVAFTYMIATIASFYDVKAVLIAALVTAAVCIAVTIFAMQTKIDFTMCSGLLFALLCVLFFFGLGCVIVLMTVNVDQRTAYILQVVYGSLGALVFALFLIFDTQMIIGGRKYELSPEEHIYAAVQLYLDVCYIFMYLLMIFGGSSNS